MFFPESGAGLGTRLWAGKDQVRAWMPALPVPDLPASQHDTGHALDRVSSSLTFLIFKWLMIYNHKITMRTRGNFGNVLNTFQRICHYSIFWEAIWDPECDWKACLSPVSSICCCGRGGWCLNTPLHKLYMAEESHNDYGKHCCKNPQGYYFLPL